MASDIVKLGEAAKLGQGDLPTGLAIYAHYLHLRIEKRQSGEWKQNTSFGEAVRVVTCDVAAQWDKTGIPHILNSRDGRRKISIFLTKCHTLCKVPAERRAEGFGQEFNCLFDVAACPHLESCNCDLMSQVL